MPSWIQPQSNPQTYVSFPSICSCRWFFQWSCMDVRVGLWRRLSSKELMLLNCGVGEDSWESLGLQGDPTSPILKEISPGISLEGMMLKLKLQYFGHLMRRVDSLEKTLMLGGIGGCREQGIKKVEKCLQTRLSTRAEHSCKRDVQLRILFVPMGKEHCLHTRMFLWFLKRNRPWDKTESKLIRKFPKTKS